MVEAIVSGGPVAGPVTYRYFRWAARKRSTGRHHFYRMGDVIENTIMPHYA